MNESAVLAVRTFRFRKPRSRIRTLVKRRRLDLRTLTWTQYSPTRLPPREKERRTTLRRRECLSYHWRDQPKKEQTV